jgi:OOP family OmpA-OmpF porin
VSSPAANRPVLGLVLAVGLAQPAAAVTLEFPAPARIAASRSETLSSHLLPTGPWAEGQLPARRVEGALDQTAWAVDAPGLTTLELLAPLRAQLVAEGFTLLWECDTANCGGFDFRYATDVLPEPDMHVNLGDFRFLAAERPVEGGVETVTLLVSRSASQGYVQVLQVTPADAAVAQPDVATVAATDPAAPAADPAALPDTARALREEGAVALDDLAFATGSAELSDGRFASLAALAEVLNADPSAVITLVGHTDAAGDLAGNIALSKARAASVRDRLVAEYGAPAGRIRAEGVGYLAPRASNLTPEGRRLNRRVEAMLTVPR